MKKMLPLLVAVSMLLLALPQPVSAASQAGVLRPFVPSLPAGTAEGLAISGGLFYVSSIGFTAADGSIYVYNQAGTLVNTYTIPGLPVVGQEVISGDTLFVVACSATLSGGAVVAIDLSTGVVNPAFSLVPTGCPNGLTMDDHGNLFVADFAGSIYEVTPSGTLSLFATGGPLTPGNLMGFVIGPNDITYSKYQNALYTTNTGQNTVVKVEIKRDGSAGAVSVFSTAVPGGDGVVFDKANLIVASPFTNAVYLVAPDGSASPLVLDSTTASLSGPTCSVLLGDELYITSMGPTTGTGSVVVVALTSPPLTFADLRPGANLQFADLRGLDLSGIDLAGANLQHAKLTGSTLSGANFTGANLQWADLSGATLTGTTTASTDFNGANMQHVNLAGAVCGTPNYVTASGANLQNARSVPADCTPPL
jgi:sugar lactone lactonase YvrE